MQSSTEIHSGIYVLKLQQSSRNKVALKQSRSGQTGSDGSQVNTYDLFLVKLTVLNVLWSLGPASALPYQWSTFKLLCFRCVLKRTWETKRSPSMHPVVASMRIDGMNRKFRMHRPPFHQLVKLVNFGTSFSFGTTSLQVFQPVWKHYGHDQHEIRSALCRKDRCAVSTGEHEGGTLQRWGGYISSSISEKIPHTWRVSPPVEVQDGNSLLQFFVFWWLIWNKFMSLSWKNWWCFWLFRPWLFNCFA